MELITSVILIIFVFTGTYFNIQPFKAVIDFGEWTTESWETKDEQANIQVLPCLNNLFQYPPGKKQLLRYFHMELHKHLNFQVI